MFMSHTKSYPLAVRLQFTILYVPPHKIYCYIFSSSQRNHSPESIATDEDWSEVEPSMMSPFSAHTHTHIKVMNKVNEYTNCR